MDGMYDTIDGSEIHRSPVDIMENNLIFHRIS